MEVETLWYRFDVLDQKQREFLNTEWPRLLVDGQRRARVVRAQERVKRIAMILSNAAQQQSPSAADEIEEMMRIATELSDREVLALKLMAESASGSLWADRLSLYHAWELWKRVPWRANGFSDSDVESVCSKLASFGLIARLDIPSNQNIQTNVHNGYELLQKALTFLRFVRSRSDQN